MPIGAGRAARSHPSSNDYCVVRPDVMVLLCRAGAEGCRTRSAISRGQTREPPVRGHGPPTARARRPLSGRRPEPRPTHPSPCAGGRSRHPADQEKLVLRSRTAALFTAAATLAFGAVALTVQPEPAAAHGTPMRSGQPDLPVLAGRPQPHRRDQAEQPGLRRRVAQSGTTPLYNWFGVLRSDAGGRTVGFIPDGQLCSGGNARVRRIRPGPHRLAADPPDVRRASRLQVQQLGPPPRHVLLLRHEGQLEPDPAAGLERPGGAVPHGDQPAAARRRRAPTTATTTSAATCRRVSPAGTSSTPAGSARTARRTSSAAPTSSSTAATARSPASAPAAHAPPTTTPAADHAPRRPRPPRRRPPPRRPTRPPRRCRLATAWRSTG